jgi:hypothetical protein
MKSRMDGIGELARQLADEASFHGLGVADFRKGTRSRAECDSRSSAKKGVFD